MMRVAGLASIGCLLLAACGSDPAPTATDNVAVATPTAPVAIAPVPAPAVTPAASSPETDAWIGKWVGVEGLALDIKPGDAPGTYRLHVALMETAGDYTGTADGPTIRFTRDGVAETIRHTDGEATGLKWLADKKDCLTIKPSEGFCRG